MRLHVYEYETTVDEHSVAAILNPVVLQVAMWPIGIGGALAIKKWIKNNARTCQRCGTTYALRGPKHGQCRKCAQGHDG
jgi:ribosomal protein L40E